MRAMTFGDRMKEYERVSETRLMNKTPVAIRLDGRAFHTFCKGLDKPFDKIMVKAMQETALVLAESVQNCVFAYTQSDEITLILIDYEKIESQPWFDNRVQKLCSITASIATMTFNQLFVANIFANKKNAKDYINKFNKALFDARCFNIPREEVCNLIYWRQQDATRNSILSVGQAYFSARELHKKNCNEVQEMLFTEKGVNWNDYPTHLKRGTAIIKENGKWVIDEEMPILRGKDRKYVNDTILYED